MAQVFISYRSTERPLVQKLADDIEKLGHQVWFDEQLTGGHKWWDQILEEIKHADVVVLALSPAALASEPCLRERQYAIDLDKNIIPVQILDNVNFKLLPSSISELQVINYISPDVEAAFALARAFGTLPPQRPLPNPLPIPPEVPLTAFAEIQDELEQLAISADRQEIILSRLRRMVRVEADREDALILLKKLRRHRGVRVHIAEDIDLIIQDSQAKPVPEIRQNQASNISTAANTSPALRLGDLMRESPASQAAPKWQAPPLRTSREMPRRQMQPINSERDYGRTDFSTATRAIPRPTWSNAFSPDWTIIIFTVLLELLMVPILNMTYSNYGGYFWIYVAWIAVSLFQGYATRWLSNKRGLFPSNLHSVDFLYGAPLTFLLARRIQGAFKWRDFIISAGGWVAAIVIAIFGSFWYDNLVGYNHLFGWRITQSEVFLFIVVGLVGGYVSGLVLRLAHQDAYNAYLAYEQYKSKR